MLPKIGIGITTRNRPKVFELCLKYFYTYTPNNSAQFEIFSYNDASTIDYTIPATETGQTRIGIAKAKNKCLHHLYNADCTHIFLFDDDCFPITDKWWQPIIDSQQAHLSYAVPIEGHNTVLTQNNDLLSMSHLWGCMLYFDIEKCGKIWYDERFDIYGYEHCELSRRLHRQGKSPYLCTTIKGIENYIYSLDFASYLNQKLPAWQLEGEFKSSVDGEDAKQYVAQNQKIWDLTA